jgi:PH domain
MMTWRVRSDKVVEVYLVLFDDIILLLLQQDDKLVLRCQSALHIAGREGTRFVHSPIIRLRDLLVRDNAAGLFQCALCVVFIFIT